VSINKAEPVKSSSLTSGEEFMPFRKLECNISFGPEDDEDTDCEIRPCCLMTSSAVLTDETNTSTANFDT
jgi:hypothetical protein